MVWTGSARELYLDGQNYSWYHQVSGELVVVPEAIGKHQHGAKEIPSGFFAQPDTEHVSAVLFSNSATASKFNRMGFLAGSRPDKDWNFVVLGPDAESESRWVAGGRS